MILTNLQKSRRLGQKLSPKALFNMNSVAFTNCVSDNYGNKTNILVGKIMKLQPHVLMEIVEEHMIGVET